MGVYKMKTTDPKSKTQYSKTSIKRTPNEADTLL